MTAPAHPIARGTHPPVAWTPANDGGRAPTLGDTARAGRQNGGMLVTPDVIGVVIAAFGGAATLLAGVAGLNARMMKRIDARFERVESELVELKVAVARLEGPQPRLLRP